MTVIQLLDSGVAETPAKEPKRPRKAADVTSVAANPKVLIKDTPLGAVAGSFKDDPLWDEMMEDMKRLKDLERAEG